MVSTRSSRRKLAVLLLAGAAAAVVVALFVKDWHIVLAHYYSWQLDKAQTYDEAFPSLEAIAEKANKTGTSSVLLGKLGTGHPRLTVWFFAWVDGAQAPLQPLFDDFGKKLGQDEKLLACWSHYVRWSYGTFLGKYLDGLAPPPQMDEGEPLKLVCGTFTSLGDSGFSRLPKSPSRMIIMGPDDPSRDQIELRILGLAWFLGMWPLPERGPECGQKWGEWLRRPSPFLRSLSFDETLDRCKRETGVELLPDLEPYSQRDLHVPSAPIAGWKGPAPAVRRAGGVTSSLPSTPAQRAPAPPAPDEL